MEVHGNEQGTKMEREWEGSLKKSIKSDRCVKKEKKLRLDLKKTFNQDK